MEFLDPKAERRHQIRLMIGYGLIAIAVAVSSLGMLYMSYGMSMDKQGGIYQNGIVFASSSPEGANIYLNDQKDPLKTNARLTIKSGEYDMRISLEGYRDWRHHITVEGGDVQRYIYPKLFPNKLLNTRLKTFDSSPDFVSQSPNRRWLLIKSSGGGQTLSLFDNKDPQKPIGLGLTIPYGIASASEGDQKWRLVEWSNDNRHAIIAHDYVANGVNSLEYILLDIESIEQTQNLTKNLVLSSGDEVTLSDKKIDKFYVFNKTTSTLRLVDSSGVDSVSPITNVRAYKTYGHDTVLYVSTHVIGAQNSSDSVRVVMRQGGKEMIIRSLPSAANNYLLDMASYDGTLYVAAGADNDKGVYLFKDPLSQTLADGALPKAWRFFSVASPTRISFSDNTQFFLVESGRNCMVYDAENVLTRRFQLAQSLDGPQLYAEWMDGHRLVYVSGGKITVTDYDNTNPQNLIAALPNYRAYFSSDYKYMYSISSGEGSSVNLETTSLVVAKS